MFLCASLWRTNKLPMPFPIFSAPHHTDAFRAVAAGGAVSGLPNVGARLQFLSQLLRHQSALPRCIAVVCENAANAAESCALAPIFLGGENYDFFDVGIAPEQPAERVRLAMLRGQDESKKTHSSTSPTKKDAKKSKTPAKTAVLFFSPASVRAGFPSAAALRAAALEVRVGMSAEVVSLLRRLDEMGYEASHDALVTRGCYRRSGDTIDLFPPGAPHPLRLEIPFGTVANIHSFSASKKMRIESLPAVTLPAAALPEEDGAPFHAELSAQDLLVLDDTEGFHSPAPTLAFTPFPEEDGRAHAELRVLSVLKMYDVDEFLGNLQDKIKGGAQVILFTKRAEEMRAMFAEEAMAFTETPLEKMPVLADQEDAGGSLTLVDAGDLPVTPPSFFVPPPDGKRGGVMLLTDREIFGLRRARKQKSLSELGLEFLTSLRVGDFVVHIHHGIGRFLGVAEREIDGHLREYLEIAYAAGDRLFVPVSEANAVSRFLHEEGTEPTLHRLGGQEWARVTKKAKKETEALAKELLQLYAARESARKTPFKPDTPRQLEFEKGFPYAETPGQLSAIDAVKKDMETDQPMDRLVCGDVGFGKTEVAMRAAFKAVEDFGQVALISPVTILASQHYESFQKRMASFGVKVEMLSRFRTPAQQRRILADAAAGKIDILVGTHRLLQPDVGFKNLRLLIIDEEQRFGVKQKEALKNLRKNLDVLTLTATPIPRTMSMAMNKLRDISVITTPPPGRLPVMTEVRRHSDDLCRQALARELERDGQVYVLHNRVQTIESAADRIRFLAPKGARVVVGHGKLPPEELEKRITAFKEGKFDILVSSTIIENGIDLPRANTMIVESAENFGVSQLYQLRGRIGRGKRQAYALFLYRLKKLSPEAKKRLRAIVEASTLGSGFQIALRDLEIRGAGEILGANQSGSVHSVGVSHFVRLLDSAVKKLREGGAKTDAESVEAEKDVSIELPVDAFFPNSFITDSKEKIVAYQNLGAAKTVAALQEMLRELGEEYGHVPAPARELFRVMELKILAKEAGITAIRAAPSETGVGKEAHLHLSARVGAGHIMGLLRGQSGWMVSGTRLKIPLRELGADLLGALLSAVQLMLGAADQSVPVVQVQAPDLTPAADSGTGNEAPPSHSPPFRRRRSRRRRHGHHRGHHTPPASSGPPPPTPPPPA